MPTLEEQIERIADAAVEQSSSETPPGPGAVQTVRRERSRWWLGAAAAVLLLALVGALAAMAISRADPHDESASHDLFAQPSYTLPVNEPTVDFDTTETWLLPTWLPDGAEFDVATSSPDLGRQVQYRSPEWSEPLEVWTDTPMIQTLEGDEVVAIDGARWLIDETVQSDGTELRRLSPVQDRQTELSGVGTIVSGTLSRDSLAEVAASLERRSATGLERPALPIELGLNDGVVVARGMRNSVSEQLRVDTDGIYFSMGVNGDGGLPVRLDPDDFITVRATSARDSNGSATAILFGLVHPDVATVTLELTDGQAVTTPAQDEHGFAQNFYIASFPTSAAGDMQRLNAIVAQDADGNPLQRISNPFD